LRAACAYCDAAEEEEDDAERSIHFSDERYVVTSHA